MPLLHPKLARLQSHLPRYLKFRSSRIPFIVLFFFLGFTLYRYIEDPGRFDILETFGLYAEEEPYDSHLYEWNKYPGAARAGDHQDHKSHERDGKRSNRAGSSSASGLDDGPGMDEIGEDQFQNGVLNYTAQDGLVRGWNMAGRSAKHIGKRTTHPIQDLMAENRKKWDNQLAGQSKSLKDAVKEYHARYARLPPKGFDDWYNYCVENNVKIIDDYDQINHDIEPFLALSPSMLNDRVAALAESPFTYHINVGPDEPITISGERSTATRAKQFMGLIEPLGPRLPKTIPLHVSDHDLGSWILGSDQRTLALRRIQTALKKDGTGLNKVKYLGGAELKRLENKNRNDHRGWFSACDEDSPARGHDRAMANRIRELDGLPPLPEPARPAFVKDVRPGFNWCQNPEIRTLHGTMSFDFPRDTVMRPIFVLSKHMQNNEFLFPPMEAYENATDAKALQKYQPWASKTVNKIFWRGTSTGDSYSKRKNDPDYDWRRQHRPRLHLLAQKEEGTADVWLHRGRDWIPENWSVKKLNEQYLDIGLTGKPHQCNQADGTCDEMAAEIHFVDRVPPEQATNYKYHLDVDGNGWSSRLHRLMTSGSLVIKHTIFPEWHHDWLTPWVHFVPMQADYSDLYDIAAFFIGSPDGRVKGRDDLAQQIAEQGRKFAMEHWRWEDMQAYTYRLLLEYTRLMAEDRDAWSFGAEIIGTGLNGRAELNDEPEAVAAGSKNRRSRERT